MAMLRGGRLAAASAACLVMLAGCGGLSGIDDNSDEVCGQLASLEPAMMPMFPETSPEGTVAGAKFGVAAFTKLAEERLTGMNNSQQRSFERVQVAVNQYGGSLNNRPEDALLVDLAAAFDAEQMNIVANYRITLENIGCPMPAFLDQFPDS